MSVEQPLGSVTAWVTSTPIMRTQRKAITIFQIMPWMVLSPRAAPVRESGAMRGEASRTPLSKARRPNSRMAKTIKNVHTIQSGMMMFEAAQI